MLVKLNQVHRLALGLRYWHFWFFCFISCFHDFPFFPWFREFWAKRSHSMNSSIFATIAETSNHWKHGNGDIFQHKLLFWLLWQPEHGHVWVKIIEMSCKKWHPQWCKFSGLVLNSGFWFKKWQFGRCRFWSNLLKCASLVICRRNFYFADVILGPLSSM